MYLPYTVQPVTLDAETATRYALALLQEQIRVEMGDGTLLEKKTETKVENGVCMVRCTVTYLTELAVAAPFTVEGGERKGT